MPAVTELFLTNVWVGKIGFMKTENIWGNAVFGDFCHFTIFPVLRSLRHFVFYLFFSCTVVE